MATSKAAKRLVLSQQELKENLHYDPLTGVFTWIKAIGCKIRVGDLAGSIEKASGYIRIRINHKGYKAHRLAWLYVTGSMPKEFIDHINGNPSDNRFDNLRECVQSQNLQNLRKANDGSEIQLLGVTLHKCGKYTSRICTNGKNKHLGLFATPQEAHGAYLEAKRKLHSFCTI